MLILLTLIISLSTVSSNLLIILLKGSHVLTGLRKLSFLHALTHVPVNKGTLGIHQVKLVVQASPGLSDGCGVAQHAHSSLYFGQVSTRYHSGRLVVNANLEASGAPVHKLDAALGLDGGNGSIDIFGNHVTTVQQAAGHVFTMARVTFHHLVGWLKASIGDLCYRKLFMVGFLSRDDRGVCGQREVDAGIGHQVGLELCQIHIQGSIKPQGSSDGGHYLAHEAVKIHVCWALNVEVSTTDVVDGLIVYHEGTIRVLQGGVGGEDGVVGLNDSCGNLGGWVNGELQLGLLAIIDRETFHQQGGEPRTSSPTKAVENQEALKTGALVSLKKKKGLILPFVTAGVTSLYP